MQLYDCNSSSLLSSLCPILFAWKRAKRTFPRPPQAQGFPTSSYEMHTILLEGGFGTPVCSRRTVCHIHIHKMIFAMEHGRQDFPSRLLASRFSRLGDHIPPKRSPLRGCSVQYADDLPRMKCDGRNGCRHSHFFRRCHQFWGDAVSKFGALDESRILISARDRVVKWRGWRMRGRKE